MLLHTGKTAEESTVCKITPSFHFVSAHMHITNVCYVRRRLNEIEGTKTKLCLQNALHNWSNAIQWRTSNTSNMVTQPDNLEFQKPGKN